MDSLGNSVNGALLEVGVEDMQEELLIEICNQKSRGHCNELSAPLRHVGGEAAPLFIFKSCASSFPNSAPSDKAPYSACYLQACVLD